MRRRGAKPALAVALVVDDRDRQMRLVADGFAAGSDRVQSRRERTQRLHERGRVPSRRVPAQQSTTCMSLSTRRSSTPFAGSSTEASAGSPARSACCARNGRVSRVSSRLRRQPLPRAAVRLPIDCNRFRAIETRAPRAPGPRPAADSRATPRARRPARTSGPIPRATARCGARPSYASRPVMRWLASTSARRKAARGSNCGRGRHGTQARNRRDGGRASASRAPPTTCSSQGSVEPLIVEIAVDPRQQTAWRRASASRSSIWRPVSQNRG